MKAYLLEQERGSADSKDASLLRDLLLYIIIGERDILQLIGSNIKALLDQSSELSERLLLALRKMMDTADRLDK